MSDRNLTLVSTREFMPLRCGAEGFQAVVATSRRSFPRHFHAEFGFGLITGGAQRSASGRGPVEAEEGMLITVNPGEVHDGIPIGDQPRSWTMLYLDPFIVSEAVADLTEGQRSEAEFFRPAFSDPALRSSFSALFAAMTDEGYDGSLQSEEALTLILSRIVEHGPRHGSLRPGCSSIARARARIDAEPARPFSLAGLAREAQMSRFQFLRSFHAETGMTPNAYHLQRRLLAARVLIHNGQSLAEAALAAGFADQSHLTRHFTRRFGFSPGAFQRAVRA